MRAVHIPEPNVRIAPGALRPVAGIAHGGYQRGSSADERGAPERLVRLQYALSPVSERANEHPAARSMHQKARGIRAEARLRIGFGLDARHVGASVRIPDRGAVWAADDELTSRVDGV